MDQHVSTFSGLSASLLSPVVENTSSSTPVSHRRSSEPYARWTRTTSGEFIPLAARSLSEVGLNQKQVEALILKFLLHAGSASGRQIADQLALPFVIVEPLLHDFKHDRLVVFKGQAALTDYLYEITELGLDRARRFNDFGTYHGAAPVTLEDYVVSVAEQSVAREKPRLPDLRRAFHDLVLGEAVLGQVGEAINAGQGFFLYGAPGNGKTSIAERVTKAFGDAIWIPRAISAGGELIRLFDTSNHRELPTDNVRLSGDETIDRRWVRIQRPTIVAGGELTLDQLEVTVNKATGISEAPLQMKSNCGTLVVDDFGRQRVSPAELLNRWIVPLEKRCDFLNLASGRKFQVPFDQMIIFSTNLDPADLVDEAFLRRIPYKIDVRDPSDAEFRSLFAQTADELGIQYDPAVVDRLLSRHFRDKGREPRFCHPRDLLLQVANACDFRGEPLTASDEALDRAVRNFFRNG